jgi:hypothetical protein
VTPIKTQIDVSPFLQKGQKSSGHSIYIPLAQGTVKISVYHRSFATLTHLRVAKVLAKLKLSSEAD